MRVLAQLLATLALAAGPARADDQEPVERAPAATKAPEEVIVYGDPFARWDGTRWLVSTQIGMPTPYPLFAQLNHEMEAVALGLQLVVACDKTWRRGRNRHEVDCAIEDIALQAASWRTKEPHGQAVLDELDEKLTGSRLQLIVSHDGRLTNIDLEGVEGDNDREKAIREQARMLLVRAMAGFHMKLPPRNQIRQGQWLEYDSQLFAMPAVVQRRTRGQDDQGRASLVANTISGSYVVHQLDKYKGHLVVQSVGKGTIQIGDDATGDESFFKVKLDGVAIYDQGSGIMTERVWALLGRTTAGSFLSDGRADPMYFHSGRIRMLGSEEKVEVGVTRLVAPPGVQSRSLPPWKPLD